MNYRNHYNRLIARARNRVVSGYVEVHHVVPRCMGGSDEQENLVQLTAEEHFVAHQLLHKIHPEVRGLVFALINMAGNPHGQRSNKIYGWMKRAHISALSGWMKGRWKDEGYVAKHKASMSALHASPERMQKIKDAVSAAHKGRVKSAQERANISASWRNGKRTPRVFNEQARANMAAARIKTWAERRANGTDKLIAAKRVATRIKNGSYKFTDKAIKNMTLANRAREVRRKNPGATLWG